MRTLRYLFAAVAVAWAVHGCSTEENSFRQVPENELTTSQQVARARAFFEGVWSPPPATRAASQSTIQALIAGRGIVPDWQHSLFSENNIESYLEFPPDHR